MTQAELEHGLSRYFKRAASDCERDADLFRHAAGELRGDEAAEFAAHLEQCAECRDDLTAREAVAECFHLGDRTAGSFWKRLLAGLASRWAGATAVAALAAGVAFLALQGLPPPDELPSHLVPKGTGYQLHVAVDRAGTPFRIGDGARLETGDRLGFFYSAIRPGHLTVLYLDNAGEVSRLYPALGDRSAPAPEGVEVRIPDGAVLSPGAGCEWVVGLFSREPLGAEEAARAARQMWAGRDGCELERVNVDGAEARVTRIQR